LAVGRRASIYAWASNCGAYSVGNDLFWIENDGSYTAQLYFFDTDQRDRCLRLLNSTFFAAEHPKIRLVSVSVPRIHLRQVAVPCEVSPPNPDQQSIIHVMHDDPPPFYPCDEKEAGSEHSLDSSSPLCRYQAVTIVKAGYKLIRCHLHSRADCSSADDKDDDNFVAGSSSFHCAFDGFSVENSMPRIVCHFVSDKNKRFKEGTTRPRVFIAFTGQSPPTFNPADEDFSFINATAVDNVYFVAVFPQNAASFEKHVQWKQANTFSIWMKNGVSEQHIEGVKEHLKNATKRFQQRMPKSTTPVKARVVHRQVVPYPVYAHRRTMHLHPGFLQLQQ
jgi:hypothetical protein